jgi:hypothetical protein
MAKAALIAAKAAAVAGGHSATYLGEPREEDYDPDTGKLPDSYQVLHVTSGDGIGAQRLTGQTGPRKYRFVVRSVGTTYAEACWESDRARDALDEKVLTLAGYNVDRTIGDGGRPVAPENDLPDSYDGSRSWSTIITPQPA